MTSRFDSDDIYYRVMDSQLMYQSGYLAGRREMKKDILAELDRLTNQAYKDDMRKYSILLDMQQVFKGMNI